MRLSLVLEIVVSNANGEIALCSGFWNGGRCSRCTHSAWSGLLLADRLKLSNERLERTYSYYTSYTMPCLKPWVKIQHILTQWNMRGGRWNIMEYCRGNILHINQKNTPWTSQMVFNFILLAFVLHFLTLQWNAALRQEEKELVMDSTGLNRWIPVRKTLAVASRQCRSHGADSVYIYVYMCLIFCDIFAYFLSFI